MDDQKYREAKLTRMQGMPEDQRKALKEFNAKQEWTVQCWNCRGSVTRALKDLSGPCPHCGVELSKKG
jgi:Zn finger protein HypA/HybF involved in hydrogenase expression